MNTPNFSLDNENSNKNFLRDINYELENIKNNYEDQLDGVLTYNKKGVCTSFFGEIETITETIIQEKEREIDKKLIELDEIKKKVINNLKLPQNVRKIYINSIHGIENKFRMFKNAIWLEATKSGYQLDENTRVEKKNEVTKFQELVYGARVSDTPEERDEIINRLNQKIEGNEKKLTEEEIKTYQKFLDAMWQKYWVQYKSKPATTEVNKKVEESEIVKSHKNDKVVSKEKMKEYSNKVLNAYKEYFTKNYDINEPNWESDFNNEKKSLYLSSKEKLEIPTDYENVSKEKITKVVIGHEIEQHLLWRNNTNRLLGEWFMGNWYDLISEGVAKINEAIASWEVNSLDDLKKLKEKPGLGMIGIFVCENYNYEEAVEILRIYHKLGKRKEESECLKKATDMVKRRKRFFDYNEPGSSIKDSLYDRGKNWVIDFLTEDNDFASAIQRYKDLNFWKLGKEEIELIPTLKSELGINDNQVIYTLMISRILNDKLIKWKWSAKEYMNPLHMKQIDFSTKRQIMEVLKGMNSLESTT